jgi:ABC-type uncharacterized transport system permease subunit
MRSIGFSFLSLALALFVSGILVLCIGENPFQVYGILFKSSFGSMEALSYTIYYATPLIFTGLAVAIAFHVGLFNIGCEGQLYMGALVSTLVGLNVPPAEAASPFWIFIIILLSMIGGALWAAIPGILKAFRGSHEVITTIMMNFISIGIVSYMILYRHKDHSIQTIATPMVSPAIHIPKLSAFFPFPETSPANLAFFIALLMAALVYVFLWKTRYGFSFRAVGKNERTSQCTGISSKKVIIAAMMISGALAGMVGLNEIFGNAYRLKDGFSHGYGFLGIAVALLGRNHPLGVVLAALLFGGLHNSALSLEFDTQHISRDLVGVIQGLMIIFITANTFLESKLTRFFKRKPA